MTDPAADPTKPASLVEVARRTEPVATTVEPFAIVLLPRCSPVAGRIRR